jgi:hypothetical protein
MKVFETRVYYPVANTDTEEGRGRQYPIAYFLDQTSAEVAGKKRGVQGTDCEVESKTVTLLDTSRGDPMSGHLQEEIYLVGERVYRNLSEYKAGQEDEIRARAMAKLTAEERKVLGLKS